MLQGKDSGQGEGIKLKEEEEREIAEIRNEMIERP
jgi:hypothetical protein